MTTIRKIVTSQVDGDSANNTDTGEIRPFGETAFYLDTNTNPDKLTLMMFDGTRTHRDSKVLQPGVLFGSNTDAGDGSGADTIKLIPSALYYSEGSDQYLVVDPTGGEPGHIHLRAGGTQDASTADLYIGGELTHVRVSDTSDDVRIRTSIVNEGETNYDWTFDDSGRLTFPQGGAIESHGMGWTGLTNGDSGSPLSIAYKNAQQGNPVGLAEILLIGSTTTGSIGLYTQKYPTVSATAIYNSNGTFTADITENDDITVVQANWTVTIDAATYTVESVDSSVPGEYSITISGAVFNQGTSYTFTSPNSVGSQWSFDEDGLLTLPGGGVISHQDNDLKLEVSGTDVIVLRTDGGDFVINAEGSLSFPDGTTQTTAYTGGAAISKFVLVNQDGGVFGSDDGENWDGPFDTDIASLGRVAVGPTAVVYIGSDALGPGTDKLYYTPAWNLIPTEIPSPGPNTQWSQVRYFPNIERFVAVGGVDGTPFYRYSADGINWSGVSLDNTWAATLNDGDGYGGAYFSDIATNGTGFLLITENTILGSFYTTALTSIESVGSSEWLNDGMSFEEVVYSTSGVFTGWFAFGDGNTNADDGWWFNESFNPAMTSFSVFAINDISLAFQEHIGYEPDWSELTIGLYDGTSTVVIATTHGQILYWPAVPDGPFVTIPKPYTVTLDNFAQSATSYIDVVSGGGQPFAQPGEKFTITGSSVAGYNGTYYINGSYFVYTDQALTVPFDTSGLDPFTGTATLTWSHGMYIDALNYANGKFYVSNDSEEVFVSSDGGATWTEVASLSNSPGEGGEEGVPGTNYMNDIDGYVGTMGITTSRLINGSYTLELNSNGTLTLPGNGVIDSSDNNVEVRTTNNFNVEAGSVVNIYAGTNGITPQQWQFGDDGSITFPDNTIQTTAYTGGGGGGYTGSQGDIGYTGSRGDIGYTGSTGSGFTGSQGDIGYTGSQGNIGYTGSSGAGFTGSQGNIGYTGSQGNIGYTGSQGSTGNVTFTTNTISTSGTNENLILDPNGSGIVSVIGSLTTTGSVTVGTIITLKQTQEIFTSLTSATGTVAHDCSLGQIFSHSSISANFTSNFTNLNLASGAATNVTLILNQGATAYISNAVQIGGVNQTIIWQGGSAPTGTANGKDVITFSILNSSGTYTVLGQLVSFS